MADEITLSLRLDYARGGIAEKFIAAAGLGIDVAANKFTRSAQLVTTGARSLDYGDVAAPGYIMATNRGTGVIDITADDTDPVVSLKPGEMCCFRIASSLIWRYSPMWHPSLSTWYLTHEQ